MKRFLKVAAVAITALVIIFAGLFLFVTRGLDEKSQPELAGVTAQGIADGTYEGGYDGGRWTNRVRVTVSGERITDIAVLQNVLFPLDNVPPELFQRVIGAQTTNVDAVASATVTSKAYLKSIENALTKKGE